MRNSYERQLDRQERMDRACDRAERRYEARQLELFPGTDLGSLKDAQNYALKETAYDRP